MYADIAGSMALTRSLDNERYGYVLDRFLAIAAGAVHSFEGTVNQFTGDGLLAVFGAPLAHEDHARRACLAVLELQAKVAELAGEVRAADGVSFSIRCGLNSGEVVVGAIGDDVHMDFVPIGNTTALGKRIESLAPVGSAAVSASTAGLVEGQFELRELGDFELKGVDGRQRILELIGPGPARTRLEATAATRGLSAFVGREDEMAQLESRLQAALAGEGGAVALAGDPGVGKSRLVREFAAGCASRRLPVYSAACFPHGRSAPFMPMLALCRDYFGIGENDPPEDARRRVEGTMLDLDPGFASDLPLLFEFLGIADSAQAPSPLDAEGYSGGLTDLLARTVEARSGEEPAVFILEDLHWIDSASAQIVERLVAAAGEARTLVILTYRPEYEPAWGNDDQCVLLALDPLGSVETEDLLAGLLGDDASLDGLPEVIEARTGGNPFFIEEMVQTLAERGRLAGSRGAYRLAAGVDDMVLPATVEAVLAARIDRLAAEEKALVQTMSVIGPEIPEPLVSAVSGLDGSELAEAVDGLTGAQMLIRNATGEGFRGLAFKHPLTRDVAYESQLFEQRARAHRMVASAIERIYPDGLDERAAVLSHHYEASGDLMEAARWHVRAADWARGIAPAESMRHWRSARALAGSLDASPEVDELLAASQTGILNLAYRLGISREETAAIRAEVGAGAERLRLDPAYAGHLLHSGHEREGLDGFRAISDHVVAAGDDPGMVLVASTGVSYASWVAGSLAEAIECLDRARPLADDDPMLGTGIAFVCPLAQVHQSRGLINGYAGRLDEARTDFARGVGLAQEHGDRMTEGYSIGNRALVEAEFGDVPTALEAAATGLSRFEGADDAIGVVLCRTAASVANARTGRFGEALAGAEASLATVRERQIGRYFEPVLLATIARSRLGLGADEQALAAAEEGVEIMQARGLTACALDAPIALAEILRARRGRDAATRIDSVLDRAGRIARASGAGSFEAALAS